MTEPLTSLRYLADDFKKRYGVPCRVDASVNTEGFQAMTVFKQIGEAWVEADDAFAEEPAPQDTRPSLTKP